MSNAVELTDANFETTTSKGVTLVDFWAEWCGPCKAIAPLLDELASEYDGKVTVAKVDVDSQVNLAQKFGVSAIPTLVLLSDGEEKTRFVGVTSKSDLKKALDDASNGS